MRFQSVPLLLHAAGTLAQVTNTIIYSSDVAGEYPPITASQVASAPTGVFTNTNTVVSSNAAGELTTVTQSVVQSSVPTGIVGTLSYTASITGSQIPTPVFSVVPPPNPDAPPLLDVASSSDQLSTLVSVLQQDRFSDLNLGQFDTLFAPNNAAFEAFLATADGQRFQEDDEYATALLQYHILLGSIGAEGFSGDGLLGSEWYRTNYYRPEETPNVDARVGGYTDEDGAVKIVSGYLNTATVVQANIEYQDGLIHIIDEVLTLPPSFQNLLTSGNFTSLLGAFAIAEEAGFGLAAAEELAAPTIFAPTNEAFQNIGSALGSLSAQEVADILMYHVVGLPIFASGLEDGITVATALLDSALTVTIRELEDGPAAFVNGAQIVLPNLVILSGVAHGIDQVLNPNNMTAIPEGASGVVQFAGAMSVDSPPLTSGQPTPTTMISLPEATGSSSGNASSNYGMPEQQIGNGATKTGLGAVALAVLGAAVAVGL